MAKKPYQIYLEEDQYSALQYLAKRRGVTMAELVREAIAQYLLSTPPLEDPAMEIIGLGRGNAGDLAERHDDYLVSGLKNKGKEIEA